MATGQGEERNGCMERERQYCVVGNVGEGFFIWHLVLENLVKIDVTLLNLS